MKTLTEEELNAFETIIRPEEIAENVVRVGLPEYHALVAGARAGRWWQDRAMAMAAEHGSIFQELTEDLQEVLGSPPGMRSPTQLVQEAVNRIKGKTCPRVHVGTVAIIERPRGIWGYLFNDQEVLLGLRINSHGANTWTGPGGRIDVEDITGQNTPATFGLLSPSDPIGDCAVRETFEECGLRVSAMTHGRRAVAFVCDGQAWVTIFVPCLLEGDDKPVNKEPTKCQEWRWFSKAHLPSNLFDPLLYHPDAWLR